MALVCMSMKDPRKGTSRLGYLIYNYDRGGAQFLVE